MIYRYVYKITCTSGSFKDKFYFGQHTTTNLDDGYKGSGKKLLDYYKKYPNDYIKDIIGYYDTEQDLNEAEYNIIHPWLNNEMCLNCQEGGYYNMSAFLGKNHTEETKLKISKSNRGKKRSDEFRKRNSDIKKGQIPWNKGKQLSEETRKKQSNSHKGKEAAFKGCIHTEETKRKMSEKAKGRIPWNKGLKMK